VTEARVAGNDVTSHTLKGLEMYTWYEVSVEPYYESVVGRASSAQVRTLDDGKLDSIPLRVITDSVAQWLASWLAKRDAMSSTLIAAALQMPSKA